MPTNLCIFSWNLHGNLKLKIDVPEFITTLDTKLHDIIFLSECWFSSKTPIDLNGFKCYKKARQRRKRAKRDSGGICVFIKNYIVGLFEYIEWNNEDGILFKLSKDNVCTEKDIYLIFYYMRPNSSTRNDLLSDIDVYDALTNKISDLRKNNEIIVIGDLNSRCGILEDYIYNIDSNFDPIESDVFNDLCITENDLKSNNITVCRKNEDLKHNDYGHRLINLCQVSGLLICNGRLKGDEVGKFTYLDKKGCSTDDFALISKGLLNPNNEFYVHNTTAYSDHCPIVLKLFKLITPNATPTLSLHHNNHKSDNTCCKMFASYDFDINNATAFLDKMNDDFVCSNLNSILEITNATDSILDIDVIEACIDNLNNILDYAAKPYVKKCQLSNNSTHSNKTQNNATNIRNNNNRNPWYDTECKSKKREFDDAKNIYYQTLHPNDLNTMCNIRNEYRKLCRKKKKMFNYQTANNLVNLSKTNTKEFWKKIKRKQKKYNASCDFHIYFKNLFETPISDINDNTHTLIDNTNNNIILDDFLDTAITPDELEMALKKLKNNKSPGFDNIINEFLKLNTPLFKTTLLSIFNIILAQGYFPKAWSVGLIIPVFKKGDPNMPENYRGITLLSCMGKLFTSIVNQRLNHWAELNHKYDNNQYGFRDSKSTIDAMFILQNIIEIFLKNSSALFVSFIDLKKAFDCTNHKALWHKLATNGISSRITTLLKDMYVKMKLCVKESLSSANIQACNCNVDTKNTCSHVQSCFCNDNIKNTCCMTCNSEVFEPFFQPICWRFSGGVSLTNIIFFLP